MSKRVMTRHWIKAKYADHQSRMNQNPEPGTGCYSLEFDTPGRFHGWVRQYEELGDGNGGKVIGPYDMAAISINGKHGTILMHPSDVHFEEIGVIPRLIGLIVVAAAVTVGAVLALNLFNR